MNGRRSIILETGVTIASGPVLMFSLYLLAAGHNRPGGGFAGGLVAGTAVLLAWSAGGSDLVRRLLPLRSSALMGFGLLIAVVTAVAPMLVGATLLQSSVAELTLPVFGEIKLVSAVAFDVGVYLVVIGMTLGLVRALGEPDTALGDRS